MTESPAFLPGLAIVTTLVVLAVGFGIRQWLDRRHREKTLSEADSRYFARQDLRRIGGSTLMFVIALGMAGGLSIDPRSDPATGRLWGLIWLVVSAMVLALLVLGLADWLDLRAYAARQRRNLQAERLAVIEAERRRLQESPRPAHGGDSPNGPPPE